MTSTSSASKSSRLKSDSLSARNPAASIRLTPSKLLEILAQMAGRDGQSGPNGWFDRYVEIVATH